MISALSSDVQAIIAWRSAPPEEDGIKQCPLTPKQKELDDRLNYADDLLRARHTEEAVVNFLRDKYGYSKRSALRDIEAAMAVHCFVSPHKKPYLIRILLDDMWKQMGVAAKAMNFSGYKGIAQVYWSVLKDMPDTAPASSQMTRVILPKPDPKLLEERGLQVVTGPQLDALKARMLRARSGDTTVHDAEFEVMGDDDSGDDGE